MVLKLFVMRPSVSDELLPPRTSHGDQDTRDDSERDDADDDNAETGHNLTDLVKAKEVSLMEDRLPRLERRTTTDPEELRRAIEASRVASEFR